METSTVQKYERILQMDPRSRIFVELSRVLLESGDAARAAAVCERGLEHHPDSVQARIVWGKSLLALGRRDEAVQRFGEAVSLDEANPHPYELVGEALVADGSADRALALLRRGAELHPGNPRLQHWLEEAERSASEQLAAAGVEDLTTDAAPSSGSPPAPEAPAATGLADAPADTAGVGVDPSEAQGPSPAAAAAEPPPVAPRLDALPGPGSLASDTDPLASAPGDAVSTPADPVVAPPADAPSTDDEARALAEVRKYEESLRNELLPAATAPGPAPRRGRAGVVAAVAVALVAAVGGGTYLFARSHPPAEESPRLDAARRALLPDDPAAALAEAQGAARSGDLPRALAAAERARRLAPQDGVALETLARVQLQLGRYRDVLATTDGSTDRTIRMYRGIARFELGELDGARSELELTRREGKMPAEAAAWMALVDIAAGRRAQAATLTDALLAVPAPHPLALVARGRLDLAEGRPDAAERRFREALARDPQLDLARRDLERVRGERRGDATRR